MPIRGYIGLPKTLEVGSIQNKMEYALQKNVACPAHDAALLHSARQRSIVAAERLTPQETASSRTILDNRSRRICAWLATWSQPVGTMQNSIWPLW